MSTHESFDREGPVASLSNRVFGLVFTVVFLVIGSLPLVSGRSPRVWCHAVAGLFLILALVVPAVLGPVQKLWLKVVHVIHTVLVTTAMILIFYLVITPVGLVRRLAGKDPLRLKPAGPGVSLWVVRDPAPEVPQDMTRQF